MAKCSSTSQIFIGLLWCTRIHAEYQWYRVKKTKQYLSCRTYSRVVKALWTRVDSPWECQEGADGSQALSSYVSREVFLELSQSFVVTDLSVILWALLALIKNEVETCLLLWRLQCLRNLLFPWPTTSSFLQQRNWNRTWIPFLPSFKYHFLNLSATEIASNEFLWFPLYFPLHLDWPVWNHVPSQTVFCPDQLIVLFYGESIQDISHSPLWFSAPTPFFGSLGAKEGLMIWYLVGTGVSILPIWWPSWILRKCFPFLSKNWPVGCQRTEFSHDSFQSLGFLNCKIIELDWRSSSAFFFLSFQFWHNCGHIQLQEII